MEHRNKFKYDNYSHLMIWCFNSVMFIIINLINYKHGRKYLSFSENYVRLQFKIKKIEKVNFNEYLFFSIIIFAKYQK